MFSPSRISSEAPEVLHGPEVVPRPLSHEEIALSPIQADAPKDTSIAASSSWQDEHDTEYAGSRALERRELYQQPPETSLIERKWRRRRIIVTGVMVAVAFIAGGGIGGGVGSSIAVNRMSTPTVTVTASNSNPTTILDYAGCPSVNNVTYVSTRTNKRFLKICGNEIVAPEGQNIDMGNSVEGSFNDCLNACAEKEGCMGATWFIFSASNPKKNSVCYFKDGVGTSAPPSGPGQQLASGIIQL